MRRANRIAVVVVAALMTGSCTTAEHAANVAVIELDLGKLRSDGLYGPPDGLRAMHYEYCIEASAALLRTAASVDPSFSSQHAGGRSDCRDNEVLGMGNTHQPDARAIIRRLAGIPGVRRIRESVFE